MKSKSSYTLNIWLAIFCIVSCITLGRYITYPALRNIHIAFISLTIVMFFARRLANILDNDDYGDIDQ